MPIIHEARYFGPGLPDDGTRDPVIAYDLGMVHYQTASLRRFLREQQWTGGNAVGIPDLVEHINEIKEVLDKAREEFLRDNVSLATAALIADEKAIGDEPIQPPEVPLDTPSLDTTFHDIEMDTGDDDAPVNSKRDADRIDGFDRDDIGESPDF